MATRLRALPRFVLLVALVAVSSVSATTADGSTAGAATAGSAAARADTAGSSVILPVRHCDALTSERLHSPTRVPVQILSARLSVFTGAEYCHVIGAIGADFYFDLRLPRSTYRGQYVQEGCGGFCGLLDPNVPLVADDCPAVTANTLALAVDNEGHEETPNTDARWAANDAKSRLIFGSTSEHQLALVAKALIADYYGRGPDFSYFDGCSDGGERASSRPSATRTTSTGSWPAPRPTFWWNRSVKIRRGTSESIPGEGAGRFSPRRSSRRSMRRWCGHVERGGGTWVDPRNCNFSPSSIECHGRSTDACLTAAQVRVVTRSPEGPPTRWTVPLSGGEPYGSELAWSTWFVKPSGDGNWPLDTPGYQFAINLLRYMAYQTDPPSSYSLSDFHFTLSDYRKLTALSGVYDQRTLIFRRLPRTGGG